jgi:hypothetical protein
MADDPDNPYGDPFASDPPPRPGHVDDPEGYAIASAAGELSAISTGARVLRVVAGVATTLWLVAVVTIFWSWWQNTDQYPSGGMLSGSGQSNRLVQVLASTLTSTWGYLLVAVLAYLGSMLLHGQRMRLLVDAASVDD